MKLPKIPLRTLLLTVAVSTLAVGCGGSRDKYAVYMDGLQIEEGAEKGPCKLQLGQGADAPVLTGDQVMTCLDRTERALALYDEAAGMGLEDRDFERVHRRAKARKHRLEDMLTTVRMIERGEF